MKAVLTITMVLAVVGIASANQLQYNLASLSDALYYVNYDEANGRATNELVTGGTGLAMSCFNSGQGEYGQSLANPTLTAGKFGSALNGTGGLMDVHMVNSNATNIQSFSASFWVKRSANNIYNVNENRDGGMFYLWEVRDGWSLDESLVDFESGFTSIDYQMLQLDHRDGEQKIKVGYNGGGGWAEYSGITDAGFRNGEWHHVAINFQGYYGYQAPYNAQSTDVELFIDGVSQGLIHNNNGWGALRIEAFGFGTHYAKSGMGIADDFDDLGVWGRLLTQDEISWLASGVAPIAVPEPATMALLGLGALGLIRRKK